MRPLQYALQAGLPLQTVIMYPVPAGLSCRRWTKAVDGCRIEVRGVDRTGIEASDRCLGWCTKVSDHEPLGFNISHIIHDM